MSSAQFPQIRMRRVRMKDFARDLCRETLISANDLILPLFVQDTTSLRENIMSMPGVFRHNVQSAVQAACRANDLGIKAVALFPVVDQAVKSQDARAAWDANGLVPCTLQAIKAAAPNLGVITDIALDPYTIHGQDGILDAQGEIDNDTTLLALTKQALCHAQAGADIVAPSDMMDGRIGVIRKALEEHHHHGTMILAYSAKFSSSFYGPFRDAVGSKSSLGKSHKHSYQMDYGNSDEAIREIQLDIDEGADMVMVKPGLSYLDIIRRAHDEFLVPVFAYNVSGEYAMVKAAGANGWIDEKSIVLEMLTSFKRAGARAIITYHALEAAEWLKS